RNATVEKEKTRTSPDTKPRRLSFKETRELEEIEIHLPELEARKAELEQLMSSGTLSNTELIAAGEKMTALIEEIDTLGMRWLELSDI
ncbi:ABC transporter C-terminal domain-containing protein, partial [Porphyromonas loveana]|uniref:ABC transporter C-terminal domain-containing protein n=1 Tax=Porphyromonas loveana TaxID=1884669 RepID=UPI0035A0E00A